MNLNINIQFNNEDDSAKQRVKNAERKVKAQKLEPTWNEVWVTGYPTTTGKHKAGIFQTKLTDADKEKLKKVKEATDTGEIPTGVESMKKYTKTHALRMYKVLQESRREATIEKLVAEIPDNYILVNTIDTFEKLLVDLWKEEEIAVDTETTGLNYFGTYEGEQSKIVGISITLPKADYHVYIPVNHTSGLQLPESYVFDGLRPILENTDIKKILFNAKFDMHMFINYADIYVGGFHFDGMIGMKLLNETEDSYSLKNLSTKYGKHFGFEDKSATYEELFGKGGFENTPFVTEDGKRGIGTYYACKDTHLTYKFFKDFVSVHFDRLPKIKRLYYTIEKPILEVCVDMEQNGFLLDKDFASDYAKELTAEIELLQHELVIHFGDININSNQQLSEVLYDKLKLPDVSKKRSVDAKTLKKLASKHVGVQVLLQYRDLNKLLTTYIEPLPLKVSPSDNRLHGSFNQVDTATGRFASNKPNLQNLPYRARKLIIAPEGKVIIGLDFSQIEPRVLSHMSNDETMIDAYKNGRDLYIELAMKVFRLERENCVDGAYAPCGTYQPRKRIKAVLLGIMYGMGSFTLSQSINSTEEEAKQLIQDFYETYPSIKQFIDETHAEAEAQEFVETMFGRKRRFVGHRQITKRYKAVIQKINHLVGYEVTDFRKVFNADFARKIAGAEPIIPYPIKREFWDVSGIYQVVNRKSVNTKIQGSSADIMKMAMIRVFAVCKKYGFKLLATVHDEVLIEVPEDITREVLAEIEEAMIGVVQLKVPIKSDVEFAYRWGSGISKEDWFAGERPAREVA